MTKKYNPNRKPFPRGYFLKPYRHRLKAHPFAREHNLDQFRKRNPRGYWHDLGAMDFFLDNFGLLIREQFSDQKQFEYYCHHLRLCLQWWEVAKLQILPATPYWGKHFNDPDRNPNSGEPRGVLRFLGDQDLSKPLPLEFFTGPLGRFKDSADQLERISRNDFPSPLSFLNQMVGPPSNDLQDFLHQDWDAEGLWGIPDQGIEEASPRDSVQSDFPELGGGGQLPDYFSRTVDEIRILHPRHCTPDLPLRTGVQTWKERSDLGAVLRDQGNLGTCVAHAVGGALDLLMRRQFASQGVLPFSVSWLHCESGEREKGPGAGRGDEGRCLGGVVDVLRENLPCSEDDFPYGPEKLRKWRKNGRAWETAQMVKSRNRLKEQFGLPVIRQLHKKGVPGIRDISGIKAHLAAGWVVVLTCAHTDEAFGRGFREFGLPLVPLLGEERNPSVHAWPLVGYDHVDGNSLWKYQGRFYALNSWGPGCPKNAVYGEGVVSLPFTLLLTEGVEAFALRF